MSEMSGSRFGGVCPTCHGRGWHGGHCPNGGKPESDWTTHEERVAARNRVSLDAAWAEAEAALPEGWRIEGLWHSWPPNPVLDPEWGTTVSNAQTGEMTISVHADGPTPAAALRALAAKLRER
jgi:hypothetical protein